MSLSSRYSLMGILRLHQDQRGGSILFLGCQVILAVLGKVFIR